jgi:hypothetical protein
VNPSFTSSSRDNTPQSDRASYQVGAGERAAAVADVRELATESGELPNQKTFFHVGMGKREQV